MDAAVHSEGEESVASSADDAELNTFNTLYLKYDDIDFKWQAALDQHSTGQACEHRTSISASAYSNFRGGVPGFSQRIPSVVEE